MFEIFELNNRKIVQKTRYAREPFGIAGRVDDVVKQLHLEHQDMTKQPTYARLGVMAAITALTACGGSGGSPNDSVQATSDVTAIGQITGFGSIYVNGIRFDTSNTSFDVDDATASGDDALDVGMIVKVKGTVNADGTNGVASAVYYDDEVEGVVENLTIDGADMDVKTFRVMGIDVRAERGSTNFDAEDGIPFDFDALDEGDQVEVSGYFSTDVLVATYIELQIDDDGDYEVKGVISDYNGSDAFVLNLKNGQFFNVTLAPGAEIPDVGIADGQYVEVEGTVPDPIIEPDELLAFEVELEDEDRIDDEDSELEVKGTLEYDASAGTWSVLGIDLAFDSDTEFEPASLRGRTED
ncbi:MAG: DUF5666 domain-containing protein, partial [Woeseiaceae bacterium]